MRAGGALGCRADLAGEQGAKAEMSPISFHEDTGLIPGLAQWVKDLAVP